MIPYCDLVLPKISGRPYVYTNFVQTIDGKTQVKAGRNGYWPIGSAADYQGLLELRARSDVLIHGRKTATWTRTIDNLAKSEFRQLRQRLGKQRHLLYIVISARPNKKLLHFLTDVPSGVEVLLVTTRVARLSKEWSLVPTLRLGQSKVPVKKLVSWLGSQGHQHILVEGGPTLLRDFLDASMLDELFLTIAPKIFAGSSNETLGLSNGPLYQASKIIRANLLSFFMLDNELFLRYRIKGGRI